MRPILPLLLLLSACSDYDLQKEGDLNDGGNDDGSGTDTDLDPPEACDPSAFPAEEVGRDDTCPEAPEGGFDPVAQWTAGTGDGCLSLPVVGDLDGDGTPEVVANFTDYFNGPGTLTVLDGASGVVEWEDTTADLGFGSPPALGDLDGDGSPEIVGVRQYESSLGAEGDFTAVAWTADGEIAWESEHFTGADFDYATAPIISDMDHDGNPEIVLGRVILHADGTTRGVGEYGRGSYGITDVWGISISESSVPAVADLDLDGVEEVIVGNAKYDPDGAWTWVSVGEEDAMIGVANLDDDPEGEVVAVTGSTVRAHDTSGAILWGPLTIESANILAPPTIGDLDADGYPEIVTAGGNELWVLNHDGSVLWTAAITDESGATGASIFDFEGDGVPDVVYIDEVAMMAFEGPTGALKFKSTEHSSNTMFDYPVVADVDADGQAEILVCHNFYGVALTAYKEGTHEWMPARGLWNQHAYSITNIEDDLSVPVDPTPGFVDSNTWHAAISTKDLFEKTDLQGEILEVCLDDCDEGRVWVTVRGLNRGDLDVEPGTPVALYAVIDGTETLVATTTIGAAVAAGWTSDGLPIQVAAEDLDGAEAVWVEIDDDGAGVGVVAECSEENNGFWFDGPFCD